MTSEIKPGSLCFVVRNVTGHPCIAADLGRPLTVGHRMFVPEMDAGSFGVGFVPVWTIKNGPVPCSHCGGLTAFYLEADLQAIDGPGQGRDVPAERPVWVGVDLGRPATVDEAARMLEALR